MTDDMGRRRKLPPGCTAERDRHGNLRIYYRLDKGPRVRLRAEIGTEAFESAYKAAREGVALPDTTAKPSKSTLSWLVERYMESAAWSELSHATRRQRSNILKHIVASAGSEPFADITRAGIVAGIDRRRDRPAAARHFLDTMRGLYAWATYAAIATVNPTDGVRPPKTRSQGHHVWTVEEIAQFQARWPLGTRARLAFDILLYTGLRRGDAVRLGRQHLRDGMFSIATEKTGTVVHITLFPPLEASIEAGPCGDMTYIVTSRGRNMTKESFGTWFRDVCNEAGLPHCSAHGLRKAGSNSAALHLGAFELMTVFGWEKIETAEIYTRQIQRELIGRKAGEKLKANMYPPHLNSGEGKAEKKKG